MYFLQIQSHQIIGYNFKTPERKIRDIPLVSVDIKNGFKCVAFGEAALNDFGKERDKIYVCNPFQSYDTILTDNVCSEEFLRWFLAKKLLPKFSIIGPHLMVQLIDYERELYHGEKKLISEMMFNAGARKVFVVKETTPIKFKENKTGRIDLGRPKNVDPSPPNSIIKSWSNKTGVWNAEHAPRAQHPTL